MPKEKSASQILKKRARRQPRALLSRLVKWSLVLAVIMMMVGATVMVGVYFYLVDDLPKITSLKDYHPSIITTVYSDDNRKIAEFYKERRIVVPLSKIPVQLQQAFIAAEDRRFWVHPGVDYRGLLRALYQFTTTGEVEAGGSTLTQQLARSYFLSLDRTIERKFKEAALAVRIEKEFTKEQIMALFLNKMFFGQRAYGVSAAAQVYFNKPLKDLNIAEAATLAGVLPAPSRYNPVRSVEEASKRRGYVLGRMRDLDYGEGIWGAGLEGQQELRVLVEPDAARVLDVWLNYRNTAPTSSSSACAIPRMCRRGSTARCGTLPRCPQVRIGR